MGLLNGLLAGDGTGEAAPLILNIQNLSAAGDTINKSPLIELRATSPLTMTSTPTITAGVSEAERMIIRGSDAVNTITLQSETNLAGSNLYMKTATDVVLGQNAWIEFRWDALTSRWNEQNRSLNS